MNDSERDGFERGHFEWRGFARQGSDRAGGAPPSSAPSRSPGRRRLLGSLAAWPLLIQRGAQAQTFPSKPVRLVVPSPPGGGPDRVTRMVAERLSRQWGTPVLVENKPGATTRIGAEYVARSPADGYTLLSTFTSHVQLPALQKNLPFDTVRDFAPVSQMVRVETLFAVRADAPWMTLRDFIAAARTAQPPLTYASFGQASSFHIYGATLAHSAKIPLTHVPYKGEALQLNDLLGGQVMSSFNSLGTALPMIRAGRVRPLALVAPARSKVLPDLPTFAEQGVGGLETVGWFGVLAPAQTPREIVQRLSADIAAVIGDAEVTATLRGQGLEPVGSSADQFTATISADIAKWRSLVAGVGIEASD
ncbi:MAG TPA: tripartite tricarboxylate transporter substrate binding protein [Burkholderiaceae bacterium]|nr:tripartite tricarboxylate transporter substrate binding protein [Burkholderiaceae bacterium]